MFFKPQNPVCNYETKEKRWTSLHFKQGQMIFSPQYFF